jgi:hypothetical protein
MNDLRVSFPKPCRERWDDMRSQGRNRFCERCDKIIHDLSRLTLDEAEELARSGGQACVRAEVGAGGLVRLKPSDTRNNRRMVAAIGASVGILAASGQAAAAEQTNWGAIKGQVVGTCGGGSVSATAADGRVYHAKVGINGRYKVKRLPAGSYEVEVDNARPQNPPEAVGPENPSEAPTPSQVIVNAGHTSVLNVPDPNACIIIGMLKVEDDNGQRWHAR